MQSKAACVAHLTRNPLAFNVGYVFSKKLVCFGHVTPAIRGYKIGNTCSRYLPCTLLRDISRVLCFSAGKVYSSDFPAMAYMMPGRPLTRVRGLTWQFKSDTAALNALHGMA